MSLIFGHYSKSAGLSDVKSVKISDTPAGFPTTFINSAWPKRNFGAPGASIQPKVYVLFVKEFTKVL